MFKVTIYFVLIIKPGPNATKLKICDVIKLEYLPWKLKIFSAFSIFLTFVAPRRDSQYMIYHENQLEFSNIILYKEFIHARNVITF